MRRSILALFVLAGLGAAAVATQPRPAEAACQLPSICLTPIRITPAPTPIPATRPTAAPRVSLRPDLALDLSMRQGMPVGGSNDLQVRVRNVGLTAANNVEVRLTFPAIFDEAYSLSVSLPFSPDCDPVTTPRQVVCRYRSLGPGEEAMLTIGVRAAAVGQGTVVGAVDPNGTSGDANHSNNARSVEVSVAP
jgi:hypothetical protein